MSSSTEIFKLLQPFYRASAYRMAPNIKRTRHCVRPLHELASSRSSKYIEREWYSTAQLCYSLTCNMLSVRAGLTRCLNAYRQNNTLVCSVTGIVELQILGRYGIHGRVVYAKWYDPVVLTVHCSTD